MCVARNIGVRGNLSSKSSLSWPRQCEVLVVLLAAASMVAVPVMKLFSLTVKTLAKPVAKRIKSGEEQKDVDGFRNVTAGYQYLYVRKYKHRY